jgi:hypothetical protein
MKPQLPLTGGCACGAVRYEITAEPSFLFQCHCRDCQRLSGSAFVPVVYLPKSGFRWTKGTIRHHFTESARGGQHKRGFCAECGSRISGGESETGIGVTASSLDDASFFRPQVNIWVSDACPWVTLDPELPAFPEYPPQG